MWSNTPARASSLVRYVLRAVRSVFSDEKKLSIAALSQTLPDRLIEQTTPLSAISRWNCSLEYWLPRSEWCSSASGLPRRQIAITRASVTSCAVIAALIDQPTTRRENRSTTAATYSHPSAVQIYVKSAIHRRLGAGAAKARSSTFEATAEAGRSPKSGGSRRR